MKKAEHHPALRMRVILVFLIAVLIPTIFLGYIGLTGIESEQRLQKQIAERNLENSLELAARQLETEFNNEVNNAFTTITTGLSASSFNIFSEAPFLRQNGLIRDVFLLDNEYKIIYPPSFLDTDLNSFSSSYVQIRENEHLQRGERFELNGQFEEAINEYNRGRLLTDNRALALTFLIRIARCEVKSGRIQNAISTYSEIIHFDIDKENNSELSRKLIAYQQLLHLMESFNSDLARETLVSFYEYLVQNYVYLQKAQFDFYLNNIHAYVSKNEQEFNDEITGKLALLKNQESKIKSLTELHYRVQTQLIGSLRASLNYTDFNDSFLIEQAESDGLEYLLAIKPAGSDNSYVLLTLDRSAINEFLISFTYEYEYGQNFQIALKSENGWIDSTLIETGIEVSLSKNLSSFQWFYPGLTLALIVPEEAIMGGLFSENINLYYLYVVTIILIIVLGLFFLFRDIYREEQLYRMKSDFISNVTHDIKTPISTMRTLAENLSEGWIKDPASQQEYFTILTRESERLSQVVENILEFSRGEAGKNHYEMKVVSLDELVHKIAERFKTTIQGKNVSFKATIPQNLPEAFCNPDRIEHAVLNLLDNALKYSGDHKEIELTAGVKNGHLQVSVRDNGFGIKKNEQDKIFQKFYRIESSNGQNKPGSGIGLSLVQDIVNQHDGNITVDSKMGEGSTFSISIPIKKVNEDEENSNR